MCTFAWGETKYTQLAGMAAGGGAPGGGVKGSLPPIGLLSRMIYSCQIVLKMFLTYFGAKHIKGKIGIADIER